MKTHYQQQILSSSETKSVADDCELALGEEHFDIDVCKEENEDDGSDEDQEPNDDDGSSEVKLM